MLIHESVTEVRRDIILVERAMGRTASLCRAGANADLKRGQAGLMFRGKYSEPMMQLCSLHEALLDKRPHVVIFVPARDFIDIRKNGLASVIRTLPN